MEQVGPLLLPLLVFGLFWLLFIRPQRAVRARRMAVLADLAPGRRIISAGGIHGTVRVTNDDTLDVEIADGVVVTLDRRGVAEVLPDDEPARNDDGASEPVTATNPVSEV